MQHRRHASLTTRLVAVVALVASTFGAALAMAPPAAAAGTWQNPGNWSFYNVDGALLLAGQGTDPSLLAPTVPFECNNGTNDDPNAANGGKPTNYQDTSADFGSVPADAQCTSAVDDSEIQTGLQTRTPTRVNAAIDAAGNVTVASPGTNVVFPTLFQYTNQTNLPLGITVNGVTTVAITATAASGNLDPATGSGTMNITLSVVVTIPVVGACNAITINIAATTGTSGSLTGTSYNPATGLVEVVDNQFTVPALSGGLLGNCTAANAPFGLPAAAGASTLRMRMRVLPNPVLAQPTVTGVTGLPGTITEGDVLTLTPTATDPDTSLCASPCVPSTPTPSWNYRWTQTAGTGLADSTLLTSGDRILNGVTESNGVATFTVPAAGAYSIRVDAGNGGSTSFGTSFTVNFNAVASTVSVSAGPDLTTSAGQTAVNNPVKLTSTMSGPAPRDATGRTYAWTKAGTSTCAAADLTFTTPTAQNTTFSTGTPVADCFVDAVITGTVNGKNASDTVRVFVKATTTGTIRGTVTACTASCVPLASGTAYAFTQPANTPVLSAPITAGAFSIPVTNGTAYKVFYVASGVTSEWYGGRLFGTSKSLTAPFAGADKTLYGGASANGTLNTTTNSAAGGTAPDGTKVRVYDSKGIYYNQKTTVGGAANFTGLNTDNYKIDFGPGSATLKEVWADNGLNVSSATAKTVTSGGAPTAVTMTLPLKTANTDFQFNYDGGIPSASAANSITDSTKAWTANQWVGFRAHIYGGRDGRTNATSNIRNITTNTATQITVGSNFPQTPEVGFANYEIMPGKFMSGATGGGASTLTDAGQAWAVNSLVGYQVRILFGTGKCSGACTGRIVSNTATQITIATAWTTNPASGDGYQIIPLKTNGAGGISGFASVARTGGAVPAGVDKEARVYNASTGAFVGKVNVTGVASPLGGMGNFSFVKWTADPALPNAQNGLPAGTYKLMFRIIGAGGGAPAFCSRWAGTAYTPGQGGPNVGTFATAATLTVSAGANTQADIEVFQDAGCTTTN